MDTYQAVRDFIIVFSSCFSYALSSIKHKKNTIIRMTMINYLRCNIFDYDCYNGKVDKRSHPRCSVKNGILKTFRNFPRKTPVSLVNKVAGH